MLFTKYNWSNGSKLILDQTWFTGPSFLQTFFHTFASKLKSKYSKLTVIRPQNSLKLSYFTTHMLSRLLPTPTDCTKIESRVKSDKREKL